MFLGDMLSSDIEFDQFLRSRTRRVLTERFFRSPTWKQDRYDEETQMLLNQMHERNERLAA